MSGIAGMLSVSRENKSADVLAQIGRALERIGPDGMYSACRPPAAMLYKPFYTTPEEALHTQPVSDGRLLVTFDGRLDNREELCRRLAADPRDVSDADLIGKAYQAWGIEFPRYLLGDFAAALWDEERQRLLLTRDPFGIRPLYFARCGSGLIWSSTTDSLLPSTDTARIDKRFLATYLWSVPDETHSPFEAITPVTPGHCLVVEGGSLRQTQYWAVSDLPGHISYKYDRDYEEHFLSLFREAVRARLRARGPVTTELSGGLDSSSISCMASLLLADAAGDKLRTLSFVYPGFAGTDELQYISIAESAIGGRHHHLEENDATLLSGCADPAFVAYPCTLLCFPGKAQTPLDLLNAEGSRVVLSGEAGDAAFRNDEAYPILTAGTAGFGRLSALWRRALHWAGAERTTVWNVLSNCLIKPRLGMDRLPSLPMPNWFSRDLITDSGIQEYAETLPLRVDTIRDPAIARHCHSLLLCRSVLASGGQGYRATWGAAETRYPYLDLPLLKFLLSIPSDQIWRPGERRSIMRRGMAGILPDAIRKRQFKAVGNDAFLSAVEANWNWLHSVVLNSVAVAGGYVAREPLIEMLRRIRFGIDAGLLEFLRFLSAELWLQNLAGKDARAARLAASA